MQGSRFAMTLCWDCAKATGGCCWADRKIPVSGWTAEEVCTKYLNSYTVYQCPEFKRDALNGGAERLPKTG